MNKHFLSHCVAFLFCFLGLVPVVNAEAYQPSVENLEARKEFNNSRFGIFLHWGIYSSFAQGEWYLHNKGLLADEYAKAANAFYPHDFNAKEWVSLFKRSGAKYITITTRHHDGFSLFDTKHSDYNIMNTPFKRDVIKELTDACHAQNVPIHYYYSHLDWTRHDYPLGDTGHSSRPESTGYQPAGYYNSYLQFMKNQLTELLTNYGDVAAVWFDGFWDHKADFDWKLREQYDLIHQLQPACLVGNNHHTTPFEGEDFQMFERDVPGENENGLSGQAVSQLPLETCQTMNDSWGYCVEDQHYKSLKEIIHLLVRTSAKGANLLLNVGPQADGNIPQRAVERLEQIGKWLETNGTAIYGTDAGPISKANTMYSTRKGNTIYLHVLNTTLKKLKITVPEQITGVTTLSGESVSYTQNNSDVTILLPKAQDDIDNIVVLTVRAEKCKVSFNAICGDGKFIENFIPAQELYLDPENPSVSLPKTVKDHFYLDHYDASTHVAVYKEVLPFKVSTSEKVHEYFMTLNNHNGYLVRQNDRFGFTREKPVTDEGIFSFYGNSIDGFRVGCKAVPNQYLFAENFENATPLTLSEIGTYFTLYKADNGFRLGSKEGYCLVQDWGDINRNLTIWGDKKGLTGIESLINIESVNLAADLLEKNVSPYFRPENAGGYFALSAEAQQQLNDEYLRLVENCTLEEYEVFKKKLQELLIRPQDGFYRLSIKVDNNSSFADGIYYLGAKGAPAGIPSPDGPETIVRISNDQHHNFSISLQGKYVQGTNGDGVVLSSTPVLFSPQLAAPGRITLRAKDNTSNRGYLHVAGGSHRLIGWESVADASKWKVEDVGSLSVDLNEFGTKCYTSLYLPFSAQIVNDVAAYYGSLSENKVHMHPITDQIIPANTGIVVQAEPGIDHIELRPCDAKRECLGDIKGTNLETQISAHPDQTFFVLAQHDTAGEVGFYKTVKKLLPANAAFLQVAGGDLLIDGFRLDFGDVTGITEVGVTSSAEPTYDLIGRRVRKSAKGVYISSHKKMYLK